MVARVRALLSMYIIAEWMCVSLRMRLVARMIPVASPLYTVWCEMWPSWYYSEVLHLLSLYRTVLAPILLFILEPSVNIFESGLSWAMLLMRWHDSCTWKLALPAD